MFFTLCPIFLINIDFMHIKSILIEKNRKNSCKKHLYNIYM